MQELCRDKEREIKRNELKLQEMIKMTEEMARKVDQLADRVNDIIEKKLGSSSTVVQEQRNKPEA